MEILQTNITLDVYDHDGTRPSIKSIALDDNTRYVFARLTYQGELYDIGQNATVKLIIIRPDKVGAQVEGEAKGIEIWDEQEQESTVYGAYAELDQPAIAVSGTLLGQFVITSGDQILRTQIFAVNNGQALDAEEWAGQYDGYNLDELVEKVDMAVSKVDGMETDISDLKSELNSIQSAVDMVVTQEEITPAGSSQIVDLTGYTLITYKDQYDYYQNVEVPFGSDKTGKKYYMNPWGACNLTRVKAYDSQGTLLSYGDSSTTFSSNQFSSIERVNNTTIKKIQGGTDSRYDTSPAETLYEYNGVIDHLIIEMVRNSTDNRATPLGLAEERSTEYIPYQEGGESEYQTVYNPDMAEYVHDYIEEKYPSEGDSEKIDALEEKVGNYTKTESLINLYDKSLAVDGSYYNSSLHKVISGNANYAFSGYIPVKPNTQYCISCDKTLSIGKQASYYQEWDANKTLIQNTQQPYAMSFISQIQTGANTAFVSINFAFGQEHTTEQFNALIDTVMLVEGCMRPLEYVAYNAEPVVIHNKLDIMRQINADRFRGKKWLVTGTSVSYQDSKVYTEGVAEGEIVRGYIGNVSRCKPMLIRNEGISGSTLADTTQDTALINRYQNLNMGDYDFITVEYGINDFGRNVPVGTANDASGTDTFAACLKTIIEYALAQNPIVGLIVCTEPDVRGTTTNQNGNTLKDYADVTLEIAKQYRLPVCDWFYKSGINALTRGDGTSRYFLTQSGTHPSVYGHMRMGAMLNQVFDSLLC